METLLIDKLCAPEYKDLVEVTKDGNTTVLQNFILNRDIGIIDAMFATFAAGSIVTFEIDGCGKIGIVYHEGLAKIDDSAWKDGDLITVLHEETCGLLAVVPDGFLESIAYQFLVSCAMLDYKYLKRLSVDVDNHNLCVTISDVRLSRDVGPFHKGSVITVSPMWIAHLKKFQLYGYYDARDVEYVDGAKQCNCCDSIKHDSVNDEPDERIAVDLSPYISVSPRVAF